MANTSANGSPSTPIPEVNSQVTIPNYNPVQPDSYMPNEYFQFHQDKRYDADRNLYQNLMAEGFNIHGTPLMYYVVTYDTSYDPLFGEDNDRRIYRKFPIKAMYELPKEEGMFQRMGLEELDNFEIHVSKKHFSEASKYDTSGVSLYPIGINSERSNAYSEYTPKVGDILKAEYNNTFYEIMYVHEEEEMFLQGKHSWKFQVRTFRDNHLSLSPETSSAMSEISAVSDIQDTNEINDYLTSASEDVVYTSSVGESPSEQEGLSGWF